MLYSPTIFFLRDAGFVRRALLRPRRFEAGKSVSSWKRGGGGGSWKVLVNLNNRASGQRPL